MKTECKMCQKARGKAATVPKPLNHTVVDLFRLRPKAVMWAIGDEAREKLGGTNHGLITMLNTLHYQLARWSGDEPYYQRRLARTLHATYKPFIPCLTVKNLIRMLEEYEPPKVRYRPGRGQDQPSWRTGRVFPLSKCQVTDFLARKLAERHSWVKFSKRGYRTAQYENGKWTLEVP